MTILASSFSLETKKKQQQKKTKENKITSLKFQESKM